MASLLGKHQIAVNVSSLADGDSIASYLVDAAGNLLNSISVGGNRSLFVKSASEYLEDSAHVSGDYGSFVMGVRNDAGTAFGADGDYVPLSIDSAGALRVSASIDFAGDYAEDSAHVSGDIGLLQLAVRKDAQGSNVSADGDYASLLQWSEGSLKVVDIANGSILQQQVTVSSTAAQVPAANLANRKSLMLQNTSSAKMWIGSSTVTTSGATAGIELPANAFMELEAGPALLVYAVKSGAGTLNLNVLELA